MYSLDKLPEGNYSQTVVTIVDNFGNSTTETVDDPFIIDRTPPDITILNDGQPIQSGGLIIGLESIEIFLDDPHQPQIDSVVLSGGPANDTVSLATRKIGDNRYALEYPRIFPAMNPGEEYTLTVTAVDMSENQSSENTVFLYQPIDLVQLGMIDVLSASQALWYPDNTPINTIQTGVLRTEEGQLAQGTQNVVITLRSDAALPLVIAGQQINPGQTLEVQINAEQDGSLIIPVFPSKSGQVGTANFMIEVPEITSDI